MSGDFLPEATVREGLALSEKATPRPWMADGRYGVIGSIFDSAGNQVAQASQLTPVSKDPAQSDRKSNTLYIAHAANHYVSLANEVLARRKAMEDAPHAEGCSSRICLKCREDVRSNRHSDAEAVLHFHQTYHRFEPASPCDCWKAKWSAE